MSRLIGLDILRGFAITLMVIFHFCYDLNYFGFIKIDITRDPFWLNFRILIVSLFLFAVGVSLALAYKDGIDWKKFKKRLFTLAVASLSVTVATYFIFPNAWVYFGILHSILIISILSLPFINRGKLALIVAISTLIAYNFFNINMHPLFNILKQPLHLPNHTVDLAPIIPWISLSLFGVAVVGFGIEKSLFSLKVFKFDSKLHNLLKILGKNSLLIYLIHQPILFAIFYLVNFVT